MLYVKDHRGDQIATCDLCRLAEGCRGSELEGVNMPRSVLDHLSRGTFTFLRPDPAEIRRVIPQAEQFLPEPQRIFLEDEEATPLVGFPILLSQNLRVLEEALTRYLEAEEQAQRAYFTRQPFDSKVYASTWERYRGLLERVLLNSTRSGFSHDYPAIFWLHHSAAVSSWLQALPKNLLRLDLAVGREHGDTIKYKVFTRWADRVVGLNRDVAQGLAKDLEEQEEALFPRVLELLRDNVLILTEDYISPDLSELSSYFNGLLRQDGRDLRQRLSRTETWLGQVLATDPFARSAVEQGLGADLQEEPGHLLNYHGCLTLFSAHSTYDPEHLLSPAQIKVWESLADKLREFEILRALRRMVVPLDREEDGLVCRDRSMNTTWVGGPSVLRISPAARPMDFTAGWVVDPVVERFGLVYDITDFSATLSLLGKVEKAGLERAFRMTSDFQRRVDRLAHTLGLHLEKYLGDGAFFSGRHPRRMLVVALHLQRLYPEFVERGFPFNKGLRIALNHGEYRLLPLAGGERGKPRFEYFGHGLVELSRLSTGKKTQEMEEFKTYLVAQGYPEATVNKFFAPMLRRNSELVNKLQESRRFYSYINPNGALINEGIVATEDFISRLGLFPQLYYGRSVGRGYIVAELDEGYDEPLLVGFRKLGVGHFKGIEPLPVYEIIDGAEWSRESLKSIAEQDLSATLERLFAETVTRSGGARPPS